MKLHVSQPLYSATDLLNFLGCVSGNERVTTAERCPHCKLCHWSGRCDEEWDTTGNLRLVAALSGAQAKKLRAAGITTIDALGFLFSRNRLNVALSRARCLSVIFCSPALLDLVCTDLERMRLVNMVCWAKEFAAS